MRVCLCLCLVALLSAAAFSQSTETAPEFEVADVHNSPRTDDPIVRGPFYTGVRYELRFATMLDLIRIAYHMDPEKVFGGPSWLELDRYDVFAKVRAASTAESRRTMLRNLLADRFKLVVHNDSRPIAAYALTAGKHPELKEADGSGEAGCNFKVQNIPPAGQRDPGAPLTLPVIAYTCHNTSMATFAETMLSLAGGGQYFGNRLVVDQTGLKGSWDFSFRFTPKVPAGIQTTGENIPLFEALQRQLGLELEPSTVPMPVIVVDRVGRKPTANSPEAMKSFPPLPTAFEVASLKPTAPDAAGGRGAGERRPDIKNGRLYLPGITVKNLVMIAWDLNGTDRLAGAPKWMDEDRYDILAKAPEGVAMGDLTPQRSGISVNIDALRPMIRSLIEERFQLAAHMEDRPLNAYTLVVKKPKLQKADPMSRTKWQEGALPDAKASKNANPALGRYVTCQNMTMAQFAELLPSIAPGYVHTDVLDGTGLEGAWDFTFSFSPAGALERAAGPRGDGGPPPTGSAPGAPEASDPTGAVSLFDALVGQVGLKLETQKRPAPVLVIDHVERKPTDN
jgi:uncharacterized protein (TIGR03435 family)